MFKVSKDINVSRKFDGFFSSYKDLMDLVMSIGAGWDENQGSITVVPAKDHDHQDDILDILGAILPKKIRYKNIEAEKGTLMKRIEDQECKYLTIAGSRRSVAVRVLMALDQEVEPGILITDATEKEWHRINLKENAQKKMEKNVPAMAFLESVREWYSEAPGMSEIQREFGCSYGNAQKLNAALILTGKFPELLEYILEYKFPKMYKDYIEAADCNSIDAAKLRLGFEGEKYKYIKIRKDKVDIYCEHPEYGELFTLIKKGDYEGIEEYMD